MCVCGSHTGGSEDRAKQRFAQGLRRQILGSDAETKSVTSSCLPSCSLLLPFAARLGSYPIRSFLGGGHLLVLCSIALWDGQGSKDACAEQSGSNAPTWKCCWMVRRGTPPFPAPTPASSSLLWTWLSVSVHERKVIQSQGQKSESQWLTDACPLLAVWP